MDQHTRMTETPVRRLTLSLALPSVVSLMITTLYNMADTWFVSRLGTQAVAAVGVSYAIMEAISSVGYLFGTGGGTRIGMLLGAKKAKEASRVGSTACFYTLAIGVLSAVFGLSFLSPLMRFLGSSETILPYALRYGRFILLGFPVMSLSVVLATFLRCEGKNRLSMIGIGFGGILNLALDPLFIFALGLGVTGAALATFLSQCVSFSLLSWFFFSGKTETKLSPSSVSLSPRLLRSIAVMGTPSLCRHGIGALYSVAANTAAGMFGGDALIAAFSVVSKIVAVVLALLKGLSQGAQSIYSYCHGAGRDDRVREAWRFSLLLNMAVILALALLGYFLAPAVLSLFSGIDGDAVRFGVLGLRLHLLGLIFMPFGFSVNILFQAVGMPWRSTLLAALPQGLFYIPTVFLLPRFLGPAGLFLAPLTAYFLTDLVTLPFILPYFRGRG